MIAIVLTVVVVVACALLVGQAVCALCGFQAWTPLAPAAGLSVMIVVPVPALHLPGRLLIPALVIGGAALAGALLAWRRPQQRPPLAALAAALVAGAATMIPFLANGRGGILGVSLNNDMSAHLLLAAAFRDPVVQEVNGILNYYPIGPHALTATLDAVLGVGLDHAFTAFTVALPILTAVIAHGLLGALPRVPRVLAAGLAGMQYLGAAYLGEGAFKEIGLVTLFLGSLAALAAERSGQARGVWRLVPFAIVGAGILSLYSLPGLAWPLLAGALVIAALVVQGLRTSGVRRVLTTVWDLAGPVIVAVGAAVFVLIPQVNRIGHFYDWTNSTASGAGIPVNNLGNLAGPLSAFQATGMWLSADFRFPPADATLSKLAGVLLVSAALWGVWRAFRAAQYELPAGALAAAVLYWYAERTQSPYTAAKALVILSPLLILLAARGLMERRTEMRRFAVLAPSTLAIGLAAVAVLSSFLALRWSPVGPDAHARDLAVLRPLVQRQPTLFLGNDDFAPVELAGAPVQMAASLPKRPEKGWVYGKPLDFDVLEPATYDGFTYVIAPRSSATSSVPANLSLVKRSGAFTLYRRSGPTPPREVLDEGPDLPGAVLDCRSADGRRLRQAGGTAEVVEAPPWTAVPQLEQGASVPVQVQAPAGEWAVDLAYLSAQPLHVRGAGLDARIPANLDRPGPLWPVGRISVPASGTASLTISAESGFLPSPQTVIGPSVIWLSRPESRRTVPLSAACGRYVDWYLPR